MTANENRDGSIIRKQSGKRNSSDIKDYSQYVHSTPEQLEKLHKRKDELYQDINLNFWEEPTAKIHWIPVEDGEIRVVHIKPNNRKSKRPVIFISGWQAMPYQFADVYKIFHERVEVYFVETREKYTSKIPKRKTDFSLSQKAKDVQNTINYFNLQDKDFVLFGTCWGATVILQGLLDGTLKAPTICIFSPMHKLWFNEFILKVIVPFIPGFVVGILMKILSRVIFLGEKAKTQKNRMELTVREGVGWKWKRAARAARNLELFGKLEAIHEEILVISGTHDRVHKAYDYPRFADELPNGRFFHFGIEEYEREMFMGVLLYELSLTSAGKTPELFSIFEKEIK